MSTDKKVLIIDDETDLCLLLKGYFLRKNYEVFISHRLEDGLAMLDKVQADILFIDNNLPDGAGWEQVPGIAVLYPQLFICMVSAFHPAAPQMPVNAKYMIMEKPIRLNDLDKQFSSL